MAMRNRVLFYLAAVSALVLIVALITIQPTRPRLKTLQPVALSTNKLPLHSEPLQLSESRVVEDSHEKEYQSVTDTPPQQSIAIRTEPVTQAEQLQLLSSNLTMVENSLKKKGYAVADLRPWSALWTDKIHLCIMFNLNGAKPNKEVAETLASYYYPFFRNITFILGAANEKRPDFLPEFVDFISCDSHLGWYQHKCIRSCMQRGSEDTKGYFYIADDMFINVTKLANLPRTKVWIIEMAVRNYSRILNPGPKGWAWGWWSGNIKELDKLITSMPSAWLEQLKETAGFPDHFKARATSDIVFIPRTFKANLTEALDFIINNSILFCEVATCLAVNIAAPNEYIFLEDGYLWGGGRSRANMEKKAKTTQFLHPIKLLNEEHRALWIKYMENQLYSIVSQ